MVKTVFRGVTPEYLLPKSSSTELVTTSTTVSLGWHMYTVYYGRSSSKREVQDVQSTFSRSTTLLLCMFESCWRSSSLLSHHRLIGTGLASDPLDIAFRNQIFNVTQVFIGWHLNVTPFTQNLTDLKLPYIMHTHHCLQSRDHNNRVQHCT